MFHHLYLIRIAFRAVEEIEDKERSSSSSRGWEEQDRDEAGQKTIEEQKQTEEEDGRSKFSQFIN